VKWWIIKMLKADQSHPEISHIVYLSNLMELFITIF
jgi:hypothetical protein